ncbi:Daunorubicin/doxorubicin resistance ABC transporter permease protein DrrB [Micromonospora sp. MH33]|nr:Daunorubicin/doxorubicin resistance ABC transporter permease protein DrrB [Micromonospora sp. MH33]
MPAATVQCSSESDTCRRSAVCGVRVSCAGASEEALEWAAMSVIAPTDHAHPDRAAVIIGVGIIMGFRTSAGVLAWLALVGILALFTLALTWVAVIAGLAASSPDGASAFSHPLVFLPFISSAFVPTDTMPEPVKAFAEHQPVTSIVNTIRALFEQQPVGKDIWIALGWCAGILFVAYAFAMRAYHRKIA